MQVPFFSRLFVLLCFIALGACSSPMGGREGGPAGPESGRGGGGGSQMGVESLQQQLRDTAEALKLTPRQAVLWDAYQDAVAALMADQLKLEPVQARRQDAPRQIEARVAVVRNRLTAMEDLAQRAEMLYQSLDEQQKKVADQRLPATVPALYSGLVCQGGGNQERGGPERSGMGPGGRGGMGGGGMGGNMGGGMGRF